MIGIPKASTHARNLMLQRPAEKQPRETHIQKIATMVIHKSSTIAHQVCTSWAEKWGAHCRTTSHSGKEYFILNHNSAKQNKHKIKITTNEFPPVKTKKLCFNEYVPRSLDSPLLGSALDCLMYIHPRLSVSCAGIRNRFLKCPRQRCHPVQPCHPGRSSSKGHESNHWIFGFSNLWIRER